MTNDENKITDLDRAWERINALGGTFDTNDLLAAERAAVLDAVLNIIEELGGSDPLPKRVFYSPDIVRHKM